MALTTAKYPGPVKLKYVGGSLSYTQGKVYTHATEAESIERARSVGSFNIQGVCMPDYDKYWYIKNDFGEVIGCSKQYWQLEGAEPTATPVAKNTKRNCECGAWAVGATKSMHSAWCPEYAMFKPPVVSEVEKCRAKRYP